MRTICLKIALASFAAWCTMSCSWRSLTTQKVAPRVRSRVRQQPTMNLKLRPNFMGDPGCARRVAKTGPGSSLRRFPQYAVTIRLFKEKARGVSAMNGGP